MKKNIFYFGLLTLTGLMFFSSCDKIESPVPPGNNTIDTAGFDFPVNNDTTKHVLLEEFTGHRCPNCPGAAYDMRLLQDNYALTDKELVIVSIHTSSLANPENNPDSSFITDFRTTEGDIYSSAPSLPDNVMFLPVGMVDRSVYNTKIKLDLADWPTVINSQFAKPLEVKMQMLTNYDAASRTIEMGIESEFLVNKTGNYNLVIYVVEDSIVDWQVNGSNGDPTYPVTDVEFYMHRHVLRDNVITSSAWGVPAVIGSADAGDKFVHAYSYTIPSGYNEEQIVLVAYIYDDATKEILQVIEHHLFE